MAAPNKLHEVKRKSDMVLRIMSVLDFSSRVVPLLTLPMFDSYHSLFMTRPCQVTKRIPTQSRTLAQEEQTHNPSRFGSLMGMVAHDIELCRILSLHGSCFQSFNLLK